MNNNLTRHNVIFIIDSQINRAQEFISSIKEEQKKFNIDDYGAKVYTVLNLRANRKCTTLPITKVIPYRLVRSKHHEIMSNFP